MTILLRILGYSSSTVGNIWPDDYISFTSKIGLDEGLDLDADASLTRGDAAVLIYNMLYSKNSGGKAYYTALSSVASSIDSAVITSVNGKSITYRCRTGEKTVTADYTISDSLINLRGTLLLSDKGTIVGFVPDTNTYKDISVAYVDDDTLTDSNGVTYDITADIFILGSRSAYPYGSYWYELIIGSDARLFFDGSGNVDMISSADFSEPQVSSRVTDAIIISAAEAAVTYLVNGEKLEAELSSTQYKAWKGAKGTLLFNSDDVAIGFIPDSRSYKDITVSSVKASGLTAVSGAYYKLEAGVKLYINGGLDAYTNSWYELSEGEDVRLYYNDSGEVSLVYAQGGSFSGDAVVAETKDAAAELASKLGISKAGYTIIKNGCKTDTAGLAQYDVGQYDGVTNTLTVSDIKISGCIDDIAYSGGEAASLTMLGNTFSVTEEARDSLAGFNEGDRAVLLITADGEIAAVYPVQQVNAQMRGILKLSGSTANVKLINGITISGTPISSDIQDLDGSLVSVSSNTAGKLAISAVSSDVTGSLNLTKKTLGSYKLAANVKVYDWAGSGAAVEVDLDDLSWTDSLASSSISYAGLNSAGMIDTILLKDVTGGAYTYGLATVKTVNAANGLSTTTTVYVTNRDGISGSGQTAYSLVSGSFCGISVKGDGKLAGYRTLSCIKNVLLQSFSGSGYVSAGGYYMAITEDVQVYDSSSQKWMTIEEAASKYNEFTVYYDKLPSEGGSVRIIVIE